MYRIQFKKYENTDKFRPAAVHFRNHGYYTSAPRGTTAFREYWDEERNRCLYGYTTPDGEFISGYNYFYLNYSKILLIEDKITINPVTKKQEKKKTKSRNFPNFYDYDKYFFDAVEEAERTGKHLTVLKARRKGYSFKVASMLCRNYFLIPNSKGFALASNSEFLVRDGILSKAWDIMDFIDEHTAWAKKRQKTDTKLHKRASLVVDKGDGVKTEIGYKSEIMGVTLGGDYNAARGKCFAPGTKVLMYDGSLKNIEDIKIGDEVMGPDSTSRTVLETHNGVDDMYNIIPRNGNTQVVNSQHEIYTYSQIKKDLGYKLIKPYQFISEYPTNKRLYNLEKTATIKFKKQDLPLDPYLVGLWLGDGSKGKSEFTSADSEIIGYLSSYCLREDLKIKLLRKKDKVNKAFEIIISGRKGYLRNKLREAEIFNYKHIPSKYLINSVWNRLQLLAGLIDTDGYYDYKYQRYEIIQKSKELSEQIVFLCRSLGFKTSITEKIIKGYGTYYRICLFNNLNKIPVLIKRKQAISYKKQQLNSLHTKFDVTYKGIGEYYGFTVDKDHLFVLDDFTIVHNSGKLIVFEEAGSFPDLKAAWQVARPSVEQGSTVHGLMIAFGTGGTKDSDFEGLKDLFYEPDAYNCLEIENVWEEGATRPCGFFVPYTAHLEGDDKEGIPEFIDDQGNSMFAKCKEFVLTQRQAVIDNASDRTMIDRFIAERCLTPTEATLNISTNIFPKEELIRHLASIRNSEKIKNFKQVGDLIMDSSGQITWIPSSRPMDLTTYRLQPDANKTGQIVIWEHPLPEAPWGLYIGSTDPYDHDKSTTNSLLSCFIYKRSSPGYGEGDVIVAEYTGRPNTAEEAYEQVRLLAMYYNATILYENQCKGMFPYFTHKHSDYLLADQPSILRDIVGVSNVERRKGSHMSKEIKIWCEGKAKEWLNEEISPGIKRLTTIYSEALIEELISYNDDGNFDRAISFFLLMLYREELYLLQVKKRKKDANDRLLFKEPLFDIPTFTF